MCWNVNNHLSHCLRWNGPLFLFMEHFILLAFHQCKPDSDYKYTITVSDSKGCTRTDDIIVTVNTLPDANAGADNKICIGQSATISASASGGVGPYSYHWSNGQTSASTVVSPTISTTYTLTVTDAKGCTKRIRY